MFTKLLQKIINNITNDQTKRFFETLEKLKWRAQNKLLSNQNLNFLWAHVEKSIESNAKKRLKLKSEETFG